MPLQAPRPCRHPGCGALVRDGSGRCPKHLEQKQQADKKNQQQYDKARGTSAMRGYGGRWEKARATYLCSHPLCVSCKVQGRLEPATVVDHKIPHKGDQGLFWSEENWQSLCKPCHDRKTASEDGGWRNQRGMGA